MGRMLAVAIVARQHPSRLLAPCPQRLFGPSQSEGFFEKDARTAANSASPPAGVGAAIACACSRRFARSNGVTTTAQVVAVLLRNKNRRSVVY